MNIRVRELGINLPLEACGPATVPLLACGQITAFCPTASAPVVRERMTIDAAALRAQLRQRLRH